MGRAAGFAGGVAIAWCLACSSSDETGDTVDTNDTGDTLEDPYADTPTAPNGNEVTVAFAGSIVTVASTPFGLDSSVRTFPVSGTFTFDPDVPDSESDDTMRSTWNHAGSGAFTFTVDGADLTVTGSGAPIVSHELYGHTFRFDDGASESDTIDRTVQVNGQDDADAHVGLSITPYDANTWLTDGPLTSWPVMNMEDFGVTFSVEDDGGTLLMQLDSCTEQ